MNSPIIFSIPDKTISSEILRDPLGTQVIWGYYGQRIFGNKITTIANDIRNYTINLFNHYVVRKIVTSQEYKDIFPHIDQNSKLFKESLILYLENTVVYSHVEMSKINQDKNYEGLLGTMRAKKRLDSINAKSPILFYWDNDRGKYFKKRKEEIEILERQISLGVHGRYKTPFLEFDFFDSNWEYIGDYLWNKIEKVTNNNVEWKKVSNDLCNLIINSISTKKNLEVDYKKIDDEIKNNIINIFNENSLQNWKEFWEEQLGFNNKDAATKIYNNINLTLKNQNIKELFNQSKTELNNDPTEQVKIDNIIQVENFLVIIIKIFESLLIQEENHVDENFLAELVSQVKTLIFDEGILPENGLARVRLNKLIKLCSDHSSDLDFVSKLVEYHKQIMEERGLYSWVEIEDTKIRKLGITYSRNELEKKWDRNLWEHNYYIDSVRNIKIGLNSHE